jgi:rod shape-determining protein MreC
MRNLLLFIARYHLFFLFVILQSTSFYLYIRQNHFQKAIVLTTSNQVTGNYYQGVASVKEYFSLQRTNNELQAENARLRSLLQESRFADTAKFTLKTDSFLRQKYTYIPAEVVRNTVNLKNNFLTLNVGSRHGIEEDMGVIGPDGVVGIVQKVSANFCTAISLLNPNARIPPKVDSVLNSGSVKWDGKNPRYVSLEDINMHVPLTKGRTVTTSSLSAVFPENIPIGIIEDLYIPPGENFYKIKVKLFTNFENLNKVYVVKNLLRNEQDTLETQSAIDRN